jgi:hypothetical protein
MKGDSDTSYKDHPQPWNESCRLQNDTQKKALVPEAMPAESEKDYRLSRQKQFVQAIQRAQGCWYRANNAGL